MMRSRSHRGRRMASIYLAAVVYPGAALAQAQPVDAEAAVNSDDVPADQSSSAEAVAQEDIVVTATRARSGFSAPTPTQIVSASDLQERGATNIANIIQEVPAFGTKNTREGNGGRPSSIGQNFADLRGLGSFRTLVLVNGRRFVPQVPASNITNVYQVDLNLIPSLITERVEVVTGGASALWGSDAVAGVVNVILKKRYEGIGGEVQAGISDEGDAAEHRVGLIAGTNFAGDRGNVMISADWVRSDGIRNQYHRDWSRRAYGQATDPTATAANGRPSRVTATDVQVGNRSPGGLITAVTAGSATRATALQVLLETDFLTSSTTSPFLRGEFNQVANTTTATAGTSVTRTRSFQALQSGGRYPQSLTHVDAAAELERKVLFGRADYDITDGVQLFVDGSYGISEGAVHGNSTSDQNGIYNPARGTGSQVRIYADNPFIPASLRTIIPAPAGASTATPPAESFVLSRINHDFGDGVNALRNTAYTGTVGLTGTFGSGWSWDAAYGYGRNKYRRTGTLQRDRALYALAADAIRNPANPSQIICRSTLTNPSNGCVPVNLLGVGSPSAAAIDYFTDTVFAQNVYTQHAAQANLQGEPFSTWAGPVSLALGVEWRNETIAVTSDEKTPTGVYDSTGATDPFTGSFNVKEAYVEAVVPLATDLPFAKSLAVNGAVRHADYSNFGGATTWKVGATYEPVDGVLFRSAYSRDVRAPSLYELFLPETVSFINTVYRGVNYQNIRSETSGNPELGAEYAKTFTAGISLTPNALPGFRLSVDYYRINVKGAIAAVGGTPIAQNCEAGLVSFCDQIVFAIPGNTATAVLGVNDKFLNFSRFFTEGVDIAASYDMRLGSGRLNLRTAVAYVPTFQTITPGAAGAPPNVREYAGGVGSGNSSAFPVPKWKGTATASYSDDRGSISAQVRYVHGGKQSTLFTEVPTNNLPADIAPEDNDVSAYAILNLSGTLNVLPDQRAQFFWVVDNVLDKDPPPVPNTTVQTQTNGSNYDIIGRFFRLGLRFRL